MLIKANRMLKKINSKKDFFRSMSDSELKEYQSSLESQYENNGNTDDFVVNAFAYGREVTFRLLGKFHYDYQVVGGLLLHYGVVAEMYTGSGKTLTSILPAYVNTFGGKKVHIITVNDYLAKRDSEEMGVVFNFFGLTVGRIWPNMPDGTRRKAYQANIIYGINSEFGFDYLKDNMVKDASERVQTALNYCIVDEADSILIDEAKTPLIISAEAGEKEVMYKLANQVAKNLRRGPDLVDVSKVKKIDLIEKEELINDNCHYRVDPKNNSIVITDKGVQRIKKSFKLRGSLSSPENAIIYHHMIAALRAVATFEKDKNYVVQNGEIVIVDEFTGRKMDGRQYSDGLHQALEAKEGVKINPESDTTATITIQNFFRLYDKISGMSGTVIGERKEFKETYFTDVVNVPLSKPVIRVDEKSEVFASEEEKFKAVIQKTKEVIATGRPVLIGTSSINKSLILSQMFSDAGMHHRVLNAKEVEKESYIVAQAGKSSAITIATNMAGRGTDILMGGNPDYLVRYELLNQGYSSQDIVQAISANMDNVDYDVKIRFLAERYHKRLADVETKCKIDRKNVLEAGGLYVIGTELSNSKRVDDQLRGRAGRQGEPGGSKFFISVDDELLNSIQPHAREAFRGILLEALNTEEAKKKKLKLLKKNPDKQEKSDKAYVVAQIEKLQKNIELNSYEQRKQTLEFDEVDNLQRKSVYKFRNDVLDQEDVVDKYDELVEQGIHNFALEKWNELFRKNLVELSESNKDSKNKELRKKVFSKTVRDYQDFYLDVFDKEIPISDSDKKANKKLLIESLYEDVIDIVNNNYNTFNHQKMLLDSIDENWRQYIVSMQNMKDMVNGTYMSQIKPIEKYKQESAKMFDNYKKCIGLDVADKIVQEISKRNNK